MKCIVKRKGHEEDFDERKLYASVYSASMAAHVSEEGAEDYANKVCKVVKKWMREKKKVCVSSDTLLKMAHKELCKLDNDAAYMYKTHMDIG